MDVNTKDATSQLGAQPEDLAHAIQSPPTTDASSGSEPAVPSSESTNQANAEPDMTEDLGPADESDIDWDDFNRSFPPDDPSKEECDAIVPEPGHSDLKEDNDGQNDRRDSALGVRLSIEVQEEHENLAPQNIDDFEFSDPEPTKRQLRPQQKRTLTTWIDTDKTENYDPVEDERQMRLKRRRPNIPRTRRSGSETGNTVQQNRAPLLKPKVIASLKFSTFRGQRKFANLLSRVEAAGQSEKAGYKLRVRAKEAPESGDYSTEDGTKSSHKELDLRAKPYARGCWGCVHVSGKDGVSMCSLVHDERNWPCQTCAEDDHDCELIFPPAQKRPCEFCKRRKILCSYKTTRNHGESCKQCYDLGYRCIAGPAKDSIRPRIRLDRDWENDPLPRPKKGKTKVPQDCLECRQAGGPCTYPEVEGAPCIDCKWAGLPCTIDAGDAESLAIVDAFDFEALAARAFPPKKTTRKPAAYGTNVVEEPQKLEGTLRTINTNFSHPISFNCDENEQDATPCHFCTYSSLAFVGFGAKEGVEVVDWDDGRPFTETQNGHQGDGIESTRLCTSCTTSRLIIVMCTRHEMRPIFGVSINSEQQELALNALLENECKDLSVFCGLCPGFASYECVSAQDNCEGCGFKLCETCALTLEGQHDGDLKGLLQKIEIGEAQEPEQGLRADHELLKEEGALMRHLRCLSMQ